LRHRSQALNTVTILNKPSGTNGCQYVTIKNCVVTMTKGTSPYVMGIYISNGPTAVNNSAGVEVSSENGKNKNITVIGNTVQNVHISVYVRGWQSASYYDTDITIGQSDAGNIIQNFGGGSAAETYGIYFDNVTNPTVAYNTIDNEGGGGSQHGSTLYGIFYKTVLGNVAGSNNDFLLANNSISSGTYYLYNGNTVTSEEYNNNTFAAGTLSSTGNVYLTYASNNTNTKSFSGNSISGTINRTGTSGTFYIYYSSGSPTGGTETIANNTFSNVTLAGSSSFYGIYSAKSTSQNRNCYGNTVSVITGGTGLILTIDAGSSATNQVYNNTVDSISGSGTIWGLRFSGTNAIVYGNNVYNITTTGEYLYGIYDAGLGTTDCYKNQVYNLTNSNASAKLYGFYISSSGTNNYIYNNYISDLMTPSSGSTTGLAGIYIFNGSFTGLYCNTIYLSTTSSGANWGSYGIFTRTEITVELRNNIIVNTSTPKGTGKTVAYRRNSPDLTNYAGVSNNNCFYAGTPGASNLIFYDGTNSDQTISSYKSRVAPRDAASFTELPPFQDISTTPYNLHLRNDQFTFCESGGSTVSTPNIVNDYDGDARYPNTGYPDRVDYPATAPDVGADEFAGKPQDKTPPSIVYTTLTNGKEESSRVLTDFAAITDVSGVNVSDYKPRIYYKKSTDDNTYLGNTSSDNGWKYTETSSSSSPFSFTIDYNIIYGGSVSADDVIQYLVVAEDLAPIPNVGINSGTFANKPTHCALQSSNFPIGGTIKSYTILESISGTFSVGTTGDYTTLTDAVTDYNNKYQTGPVVFSLIDASYTSETLPISINQNLGTNATNTLTIKPAGSTTPTISGSSTSAVIKLNGADYVIIDGSNTSKGTDRNLTIENTGTGYNTCAIWVSSLGENSGATNNIIKNCNIKAGANSTDPIFGIFVGGTSVSKTGTGADNDNLTIQNNQISKCYYGIYASGIETTGGELEGLTINGNKIGSGSSSDYVYYYGMYLRAITGFTISGNEIYNLIKTGDKYGMHFDSYISNGVITKNNIHSFGGATSSSSICIGIYFYSSASVTNNQLDNNIIYNLSNYGSTNSIYGPIGIKISGGTGYKLYYNSISLTGAFTSTTAGVYSICLSVTTPYAGMDLKNNIFYNAMTGKTPKTYTVYVNSGTPFTDIDFNDYYTTGSAFGFYGSEISNFNAWKTATGDDASSLNVDPAFLSSKDLRPALGNAVLAAGTPITGITTDYLGVARNGTNPSMGAYEYGWDNSPPVITYTALGNTTSTSDRTLSGVTITDAISGVDWTNLPRIYYKKSTDANAFVGNTSSDNGWKYTTANVGSSPTNFTIDYSIIYGGSVSLGDYVQYFVVAQDLETTPNVGSNPSAGFEGNSVSSITSAPTSPNQYNIGPLAGTYEVGVSKFNELTGRNIYKETFKKTITYQVEVEENIPDEEENTEREVIDNNIQPDKNIPSLKESNNTGKENKNNYSADNLQKTDKKENRKDVNVKYKTVQEEITYTELHENGKPYTGPMMIYLDGGKSDKNGKLAGAYLTITAAIADLTESGMSDDVTFLLIDDSYTTGTDKGTGETFPITIGPVTGASATDKITIKPAPGKKPTIEGSSGTAIFDLNNAKYVVIDGSNTESGTTKDLTISNTNTSGPVFRFINDATDNIIKNCDIKGVNTSTTSGVIFFSTAKTGGTGNDNNTISNNIIGNVSGSTPANLIYSSGSASNDNMKIIRKTKNEFSERQINKSIIEKSLRNEKTLSEEEPKKMESDNLNQEEVVVVPDALPINNSDNIISNNELKNFSSYGVYVTSTGNGDNWSVSNNSFYNNQSPPPSTLQTSIYIASGDNHSIIGNYIGGQSANCGGSAWINNGTVYFYGIRLYVGSAAATSVQGNTIQNINMSNTNSGFAFYGIHHSSGLCNIGTTTGNIIGNTSNSNIITIAGTGPVYVIYSNASNVTNIQNNTIGYISQTTTGSAGTFFGIYLFGNASKDVSRNKIFNCGPTSSSKGNNLTGGILYLGETGRTITCTISNNQISLGNGMTNNHSYRGIDDGAGTLNNILLYYNTVIISGAGNGSENNYAFLKRSTSNETHRNNIYYNERTNSSTGKNYAIGFTNTSGTNSSDYNLFVSSSASTIGVWSSSDRTLAEWKTSSGGDANSYGDVNTNLLSSNLFVDLANGNLNIIYTNPECWSVKD